MSRQQFSTFSAGNNLSRSFLKINGIIVILLSLIFIFPVSVKAGNSGVRDADVLSPTRKNVHFIKRKHIRFYQDSVMVGNEIFFISVFTKKGPNKQKYMVIHDSEDAAFDAGLRAIKHGGTFAALENNENRALYSYGKKKGSTGQDPNRMFNRNNPYWPVAKKILELLDATSKKLIIVLHNNKPGGNFRIDTIATWKNISIASNVDPDLRSLVWIPGLTMKPNRKTSAEIQYYKKRGMNVIFEYVPVNERGDGSLSVYSSKHGIPYRNIEVEAGIRGNRRSELKARRRQIKYLNALRKYHGLK